MFSFSSGYFQKKHSTISNEISEIVGLWLAEGDNKTRMEITITNNCFKLIKYSYKVLRNLFQTNNFRLYIYLPNAKYKKFDKIKNIRIRKYVDRRATKPYYILRLANVEIVKKWKKIAYWMSNEKRFYKGVLRGFFAGEGSIKRSAHENRILRIAQKKPIEFIDRIFNHLKIEYKFIYKNRSYEISGRDNWEKFARFKIANLHPEKKEKFWKVYKSYKEWHYSKNYIRNNIAKYLDAPKTSKELGKIFQRSQCRIQDVLIELKKEGKVKMFKVRSRCYWLNKRSKSIIISKRKKSILSCLEKPMRAYEIAGILQITNGSVIDRLREMERLDLVKRKVDKCWYRQKFDQEVIVCE